MIPLHLALSGFLSYKEPVEIDFTRFHLACISGQNGAGKSSLLDAMTWVLFGQARKRDESVVNLLSTTAEVSFTFEYEQAIYRIIRNLTRGKTTLLEFQLFEGDDKVLQEQGEFPSGSWKPLTEHTMRETQVRIEQVLRLDYETFINVSFFLQGKADQFAQQPPTRRKEILGNILGLEVWEEYRDKAAQARKQDEGFLVGIEGRLGEINAELGEESVRKGHLKELEGQLAMAVSSRKASETALASARQVWAGLEARQVGVQKMDHALAKVKDELIALRARMDDRKNVLMPVMKLVERTGEIETGYFAWQEARQELEGLDVLARRYMDKEKLRHPLLSTLEAEKARLQQELGTLTEQQEKITLQISLAGSIEQEIQVTGKQMETAQAEAMEQEKLEKELQSMRENQAGLRAENESLNAEMQELKGRIKKLETAQGAECPLCGQPLSDTHRLKTLKDLQGAGNKKGDAWRQNKIRLEELARKMDSSASRISELGEVDARLLSLSTTLSQQTERLHSTHGQIQDWEQKGANRLQEVKGILESEAYAQAARSSLAELDETLRQVGYDGSAHEAARNRELENRRFEQEFQDLTSARASLKPIEDEINNLASRQATLVGEIAHQEQEYQDSIKTIEQERRDAPDMAEVEKTLADAQTVENQFNQEVGAARQKVAVLDTLRKRKADLEREQDEIRIQVGRLKSLEKAFGKDGIPALLIEQALPVIEMKANEILGRLSDDTMRLRFETQAKYKADKRKDLRETLEIQVRDGAGERDYEMFSGGEAFRVNFAIRLALSETLAQRKGARLQMLVIDEGFGSQDALGRQRLIQAINAVQDDFSKILVITHLEELKDAFPTRIEVEKTEKGSVISLT